MSDYTPEPTSWSFDPSPSDAIHQQAALEYAVAQLAATDHQAMHRLMDALREEATEAGYNDPGVGIVAQQGYAQALDGLHNLLGAECDKAAHR